jgi:hypothetical protein
MTIDDRYRYGPPAGPPDDDGSAPRPLLVGYGGYDHEVSREALMELIEKYISWHPGSTEAEAEAALRAMSRAELTRMAMGRHEMDRGQVAPGNACAVDYDPLPSSQGPIDGGLPAPSGASGAPSRKRGWY